MKTWIIENPYLSCAHISPNPKNKLTRPWNKF